MTILIPALNAEKTIGRALWSVANQTSPRWEVQLLIDPATTDKTLQEARLLQSKIRGVIHINIGKKPGLPNQYIELVDRAEPNDGICGFLDADDILFPNAVQRVLQEYNQNKEAGVIWTQFKFMPKGETGWCSDLPANLSYKEAFKKKWWKAQHFRTFKKSVYEAATFPLPVHIPYAVDYAFSLVLASANPVGCFINEPLYGYYRVDGGISIKNKSVQKQCAEELFNLFSKHMQETGS